MQMQALYYLVLVCILCACSSEQTVRKTVSYDTYFPISLNDIQLELQLALSPNAHAKGLMHRDQLPENHGMLFLFDNPGKRSFWMRNTRIPLDIAYLNAKGTVLEIYPLYPYNENTVESLSQDVLIAIEMNQGWFAQNNIRPGAQLDLAALKKAIHQRGQSTASFLLEDNHP